MDNSEMVCIYDMNMFQEYRQVNEDLLSGRGFDVLFCLLDGNQTSDSISRKLHIPRYSTQLYLQRLVKAGLVSEIIRPINNGIIEKEYRLISKDLSIINNIGKMDTPKSQERNNEITAQHFAVMTKNAIKSASIQKNKPYQIGSYFMKVREEDMEEFKKEIDSLFDKFKALEDDKQTQTYSLFTVMAPYEQEV